MSIRVNNECTGCESCVPACPFGLIEVVDGKAKIKVEGCNLCGACKDACAFDAIEIEKVVVQQAAPGEHRGIWVFAEQRNGEVRSVTY